MPFTDQGIDDDINVSPQQRIWSPDRPQRAIRALASDGWHGVRRGRHAASRAASPSLMPQAAALRAGGRVPCLARLLAEPWYVRRDRMTNPVGSFIWYELLTTDAAAAAKFYAAVVGWKLGESSPQQAGVDYRMITRSDGGNAGGMLTLSADMQQHGARPTWLGYLRVTDVDAASKAIEADGGKTLMPKKSLPVGDIAMLADPMGTPFYVMTPIPPPGKPEAKSDVFDTKADQRVRWNELTSADLVQAKAFYSKHFGFELNEVMPMGAMGDYCFIDHGGMRIGAMMQKPAEVPVGAWLFYFGVPSVDEAKRAIEGNGGKVIHGPSEVPGGDWIVIATDPDGAPFGVVGPQS